jgi:2-amino-4-hydroxy-6-hydroxymethyldihydropteridine diphosphokinase
VSETVFIGLGSNLGDREHQLNAAVETLRRIDAVAVLRRSSLYDTAPVGPPQPRYLNAVVEIDAALEPQKLFAIIKQIAVALGRKRRERWAARSIDLDILLWNGRLIAEPDLQVPHLELHHRRFVLEPLCELAPGLRHPILHETLEGLLARLPPQDVVRIPSAAWPGELMEEGEAR